tara:strand:+ start:375 stop:599 length:225 start_codon:yes stop_codon:yes gene_type:complete
MASPAKQLRRKSAIERLENTVVQYQASLKEEKDQDAVKVLKKKIAGHEFTIANTKAALKSGEHTSFNTSNFFKD